MDRGAFLSGLLVFLGLAFQVWVTWRVCRSHLYERSQKANQAKLIWFLPVLGAIIAFSVLTSEEQAERRHDDRELRG